MTPIENGKLDGGSLDGALDGPGLHGGNLRPPGGERVRQILVAGVGNSWLQDDGFGAEVVKRLENRELPDGVTVLDFGTGGLDLAYEVMRGYDAMILVDASAQGGKPGELYILEPDPEEIKGGIEDGEVINPHGMDPQTVLRFVKTVHGWPGKVVVVACEPGEVEEVGMGLTPAVAGSIDKATEVVMEQITRLGSDDGYEPESLDPRTVPNVPSPRHG